MSTLGDDFPKEQARLRMIQGHCREIGPAGAVLASIIDECLQRADAAAMSGDVIAMLSLYREMQEFSE